ncbi:uncharacterized protein LOC111038507 isoform X1 [Myzus persicae]|uniref:uncharacterized protein LOC111038507 isoform X1 n=2 Tax=Myzus persicae TaxID=13164 RepID=UPI000B937D75|nr:uncharacterized protein LOC111038507 isoform X1 [Myzus persicae]XP_022177326.1 uncharacterized protein LOC111038507 isoform X1 [Myzus persicae]
MEHQYKQHYAAAAVTVAEKMIESKVCGPDSVFVSFKLDKWHTEPNQFCSVVLYGTMTVSDRDCRNQIHPLVLKFKHINPQKRKICRNDQQFYNEKLFYEQITPFLLAFVSPRDDDVSMTPSLCRYFYGRNDCGDLADRDLIVLGNETVRGYRSAVNDHRLTLDYDHMAIAVRTLAKFHSLSYRAKHVDRVKFIELVKKVAETQFSAEGKWYLSSKVLQGLFSTALDMLEERHGDSGGYVQRLHRFRVELLADLIETTKRVMEPDEHLSVLCHSDFGRHNLMFRYDGDGRPTDALLYDMALIRYGSPALDLSHFMYLNMDRQTRDDHWDDLLDVYCETLASVAGSAPVPDRSQLDTEMTKSAYYGLARVSMAVRILLEEQKQVDLSELAGLTDDEKLQFWLSCGGKRATEWTADTLQHYLDMVFIDVVAN